MARTTSLDSNIVGLRIAEESTLKVLPGTPIWTPYEPNGFDAIGGQFVKVARNPINPSAQREKGVTTDLDASGGFPTDMTQDNLQEILQGYVFASFRRKGEELVTAVDIDAGNPDEYEVASTTGFVVGYLIRGKNFTNTANNALNVVTAIVADTSVEVADGQLVAEASPPANATIVAVGVQASADDIDVDVAGSRSALTSTTLDFTTLGLNVGEAIFIGGDTALTSFTNSTNNGYATIHSIAAQRLEFDNTQFDMVAETSAGSKTLRLFFGRFLKNELAASIVRRTYQLELDLGLGDDTFPANQTILVRGAVPSEAAINLATADKITANLSFVGVDTEVRDGSDADGTATGQGPKDGTRPTLVSGNAFNTSNDFSFIRLAVRDATDASPVALFGFAQNIVLNINNNIQPNKAIGTLGAFEVSRGTFEVGLTFDAYQGSVEIQRAIENNSDITFSYAVARDNAGFYVNLPLGSIGDGRPNIEQNNPITVPITFEAANGARIGTGWEHTLSFTFFDYLPALAQ